LFNLDHEVLRRSSDVSYAARLGHAVWSTVAPVGDRSLPEAFDANRLVVETKGTLESRYVRDKFLKSGVGGDASILIRKLTNQKYVEKSVDLKNRNFADNNQTIRKEFLIMQTLRHPNILKIVEFLETPGGQSFSICEFAGGGDLSDFAQKANKDGLLVPTLALAMFEQANAGVAFLHGKLCVHADLKPENILVLSAWQVPVHVPRVVIADFGHTRCPWVKSRPQFGDTRYLSPEGMSLLVNKSTVFEPKPSGDMWSLGVTLFELYSQGRLPFLYEECTIKRLYKEDGLLAKFQDVLLNPDIVVEDNLLVSSTPGSVKQLLGDLLQKDCHHRSTAQAVSEMLRLERKSDKKQTVKVVAQQDKPRQIILNAIMWRLPFAKYAAPLADIFASLDSSHDGCVTRDNFKEAAQNADEDDDDVFAQNVDKVFDLADVSGDGSVEFNEFAAMALDWNSIDEETLDKHLRELLNDIAKDGADTVTQEDLGSFFGKAITATELQQLYNVMDSERTGRISAGCVHKFLGEAKDRGLTITLEVQVCNPH
jgi:serine/threonine protein kinase